MNYRVLSILLALCLAACSDDSGDAPSPECGVDFPCPPDSVNTDEDSSTPTEGIEDSADEDAGEVSDFLDADPPVIPDADNDVIGVQDASVDDLDTADTSVDSTQETLEPGTCNTPDDCPGFQWCEAGLCISATICLNDGDCINDLICDRGKCNDTRSGCKDDSDCEIGTCSPILHECISAKSCESDNDCLSDFCTEGECTGCIDNTDCSPPFMGCNTKTGVCIDPPTCETTNDCGEGKTCTESKCTWPGVSPDPHEPNDSGEVATEVENDWVSEPLTLGTQDQDHFVFNVPAGHALVILVEFSDRYTQRRVELRDGSGNHVFAMGEPEASYALLSAPTSSEGRSCRLLVEQLGEGTSSYSISTWMPQKIACSEDTNDLLAPNDQPGMATSIADSTNFLPTGTLCNDNPDWYLWDIPNAGNGVVSVTFPADLADVRVRVFDEAITLVKEGTSVGDAIGIQLEELAEGPHYIQVDSPSSTNSPYTLEAKSFSSGTCMIDEAELNDSILSASSLGEGEISLTLCPEEEDWFEISAPPNSGIVAGISYSNVSAQLVIELFDKSGEKLTENQGSVLPQGAVDQEIEWGEISDDRVFIRIRKISEAPVVNFTPYKLNIDTMPSFCVDDQYEENDSPESAEETLTFQGLYLDGVACKDDLDWFKIPVADDEIMSIDLLSLDDKKNSILLLLQPDGINALEGVEVESIFELGQHASFSVADLPNLEEPWIYALISAGSGNKYRLTTQAYSIPNDCNDDGFEPNNTLLGSTEIPPSGIIEGLFCPSNPDFFSLSGNVLASSVVLNVTIPPENQKVTVSLFNEFGTLIENSILNTSGDIPIDIPANSEGPFFIQLMSPYSTDYVLTVGD